jgi:hypothetical protein
VAARNMSGITVFKFAEREDAHACAFMFAYVCVKCVKCLFLYYLTTNVHKCR